MRWTEADLRDLLARQRKWAIGAPPAAPQIVAHGRLPIRRMNKLEAAYDAHLTLLARSGTILWHKFEAIKLRLAASTFYTPDFFVLAADGGLEVHETKGFMRDDAAVKIKVAAALFPFRFFVVKRDGSGWKTQEF